MAVQRGAQFYFCFLFGNLSDAENRQAGIQSPEVIFLSHP